MTHIFPILLYRNGTIRGSEKEKKCNHEETIRNWNNNTNLYP